jgi:hypothetical protein
MRTPAAHHADICRREMFDNHSYMLVHACICIQTYISTIPSQVFGTDGVPAMLTFPSSASLSSSLDPSLAFSRQVALALASSQNTQAISQPEVACAALMAHLDMLSARILFPVVVAPHLLRSPPAHCVAGEEALTSLCNLLSAFLTCCVPKQDHAAAEQACVHEAARSTIVIGALRLVKANLDWLQRSEEGGCSLAVTHVQAERLEPMLRGLVTDESLSRALPAEAKQHVQAMSLEAYTAGIRLFFSKPSAMMQALGPLLARVHAGEASDMERQICARCVCVCVCAISDERLVTLVRVVLWCIYLCVCVCVPA